MPGNDGRTPMRTTPFPDLLLDKLMPRLRDVEWRVLCVIVRQTLGWMSGGVPKRSDWLSHTQLRRRTGRSSSALSPAIEFLSRNRLIEVEDDAGRQLRRAYDRRKHRGRLLFRLHPRLFVHQQKRIRLKRRIHKSETTINTQTRKVVVPPQESNPEKRNEKQPKHWADWQTVGQLLHRRKLTTEGH